jgi:urea transport system substrate-binding protein
MLKSSHYLLIVLSAIMAILLWLLLTWQQRQIEPVRIGVIHATTGTMATSELPLVNAIRLAVEQINQMGGVTGRPLEMVLADSQSDPAQAARLAERLITQDRVSALFACWTSSCRKAVLPIVERNHHLMFYGVQYEGMEQSPNIIYTGAAPNQQIVPGGYWAMQQFGKRVYLVGSDYIFPRTANLILRDLINANEGQIVAEDYLPLGHSEFASIIENIKTGQPDVVLSTLNGDSNQAFFAALLAAGLHDMPLVSFSVAEPELVAWGGGRLSRHYGVWSYFQSLPDSQNRQFVEQYQLHFGDDQATSDPVMSAYAGVMLWAQAVREEHSVDIRQINRAILRQSYPAPGGSLVVDRLSRHMWRYARIGHAGPDGQFSEVYASNSAIRPTPWPTYRSRSEWKKLLADIEQGD